GRRESGSLAPRLPAGRRDVLEPPRSHPPRPQARHRKPPARRSRAADDRVETPTVKVLTVGRALSRLSQDLGRHLKVNLSRCLSYCEHIFPRIALIQTLERKASRQFAGVAHERSDAGQKSFIQF